MATYFDRAMLIEDLRRATHELATSPSTIAETAALRARIVALLESLEERSSICQRAHTGPRGDR